MRLFGCWIAMFLLGALAPIAAKAQTTFTQTTLHDFCQQSNCADGATPAYNFLIQASDGNFYGTISQGGNTVNQYGDGIVFRYTPAGAFTVLHVFCPKGGETCLDGENPSALIEASDGNLYGTTYNGGAYGFGTLFRMTLSGQLTTVYAFCSRGEATCPDGATPFGQLIQGSDGNIYGVTDDGGGGDGDPYVCGEFGCGGGAYKITLTGNLTPLYDFCQLAYCGDGSLPFNGLVEATPKVFYGTTLRGGGSDCDTADECGVVFKINAANAVSVAYSFCAQASCIDGAGPNGLTVGADGDIYGTTIAGGADTSGCYGGGCGTVFKLSPSGAFTNLYSFCPNGDCTTGSLPEGTLVLGSDGNFYGGAVTGGAGEGTVFNVSPEGSLSVGYTFCDGCAQGGSPIGLMQAADGNFYGYTQTGGPATYCPVIFGTCGTIFELAASPALAAPVQVSLSKSDISVGQSVTLNWRVLNAFSTTMQQCYAFIQNGATGAGAWTGRQSGTLADGVYSGSTTIQPTDAGTYTYALTCGGIESGWASLNAGGVSPTAEITLSANNPVLPGTTDMLGVTVTGNGPQPTGTVNFHYGGQSLGTVTLVNGSASLDFETTGLPLGSYLITATYSGDTDYGGSSATIYVVIQKYYTQTYFYSSPSSLDQGQEVMLTANVDRIGGDSGTPTGTVKFSIGGLVLGSAPLKKGTATLSYTTSESTPAGTYSVLATYEGDAADGGSAGGPAVIEVIAPTHTGLTISPQVVPRGSSVTFTSRVTRPGGGMPGGSIEFTYSGGELGTVALVNGVATLTIDNSGSYMAGSYTAQAAYSGDPVDLSSSSPTVSFTLEATPHQTQATLTATPAAVTQGQNLTLSCSVARVSASGAPSGTVTFYQGTTVAGSATLTAGKASLSYPTSSQPPGTYPMSCKYGGDTVDQASASASVSVTILAATATSLSVSPNPAPAGSAVTLAARVTQAYGTSVPTGTVTFISNGTHLAHVSLDNTGTATANLSDFGIAAGSYPIKASYSGDAQDAASVSATVRERVE